MTSNSNKMRYKKVVGYARISNEDQSHFSIDGQVEEIERYCNKNNYELVKSFIDEGQSAKDFDRKSWKELEKFLKTNYKDIDYLIVMKYDRFSRNLQQSLNVIHQLEENYKIKIISIMEPIGLPPESPFFFQFRTTILLNAQVERLIIRDRTIFGQRKARGDGRYLGKAPYGYANASDENKKPIIVKKPEEVVIIRKAFELYLAKYSIAEIFRKLKEIGFTKTGKDSIQRMLTNTAYVGLIRLKAYNDENEKFVQGIHEPIIDKETFYRVQAMFTKPVIVRHQYNENAYLKSSIVCPDCYRPLTCSLSKGRSKSYWYYECIDHRKSYNVDAAHNKFNEILTEFDFTDSQLSYLENSVRKKLRKEIHDSIDQVPLLLNKKNSTLSKKEMLEDKYLSGKLDDQTFLSWNQKIGLEIKDLDNKIKLSQVTENSYWSAFISRFSNLKNISQVFLSADVQGKQNFIEKVFGTELAYNGEVYRTAFLNPLFLSKVLVLQRKGLLEFHKKTGISLKSPLWVADRVRTGDPRHHKPIL